MSAAFLFGSLFLLLVLGVPIAISLGLASIGTLILFADQTAAALAQRFFGTMHVYPLLALPFFVLAGTFMTRGGVANRIIQFANALVGHFRGGLAMTALLSCAFFAAVSGSSPATVVAVGSIMMAGMVSAGYSREFAAGLIGSAGTLGILIPPSIVLVVYGAVTETSVGALFLAGIVPGFLLTAVLMIVIAVVARRQNFPRAQRQGSAVLLRSASRASWGLFLIVVIMGGIYLGAFTPTEAAAVAAVYAAFVAIVIYREVRLHEIAPVFIESGKLIAVLMFIIANAYLFAFVLTTEQIPQTATAWIVDLGMPPWAFLALLNVALLIAGNFMDPTSVILIVAPVVFPVATKLGIDPIHLGIIMTVNMEIGLITPPVGLNLFVTASVAEMPLGKVVIAILPWLGALLAVLIAVTYLPSLSLSLPRWLMNA